MFRKKHTTKKAGQAPGPAADENELIAVITAAVYALYEGTGVTPRLRAVRPAAGARPIWATAGLLENTRPFLP